MKKSLETFDGTCPYCGSLHNRGSGGKWGKRIFICLECNKTFHGGVFEKDDYISFNISLAMINFGAGIQDVLNLRENDHITFKFRDESFYIEKTSGIVLKPKDKLSRSLITQSRDVTSFLRLEFNIPEKDPAIFEVNTENNTIMGIIKKSDIRKIVSSEHINFEAQCFIAVRKNGTCYISAKLKSILKVERGDYIMLYENKGSYYFYVADPSLENTNEAFRINLAGSDGFSQALTIQSKPLAIFLCDLFKQDTGTSFKVKCSGLQDVAGKKMVKIENLN